MNVVYYHDPQGGAEARALIRAYEWKYPGARGEKLAKTHVYKFNVLITSYHVFMADWEHMKSVHWKYVVIDEAHGERELLGGPVGGAAGVEGGVARRGPPGPCVAHRVRPHTHTLPRPVVNPPAAVRAQRSRTATRSCSAR